MRPNILVQKKLVFLTRSLHCGGSERQLVTLAKALHAAGYSIVVACFYSGGPLESDLLQAGVPVHNLKKNGRYDVVSFLYRLAELLRTERPSVLHSYLCGPNLLAIVLKPLFPKIRFVWGVRASNMVLAEYGITARLSYWLECRASQFADFAIANSEAGLRYAISNGFPAERTFFIPNGIDTQRFRPEPGPGLKLRDTWGIKSNERLIGLVGRLDAMKDHPTFLRAAAILAQRRTDVRFVVVGDGDEGYERDLKQLASELGLKDLVIWAGSHQDMAAVYSAFDLATSSSISEGFPNVIGEAMACGAPCVVTDVGDSASIVGESGIVVPPSDPAALAKGWETGLDYRAVLSEAARNRIKTYYEVDSLMNRTIDALWPNK